MAKKKYNTFNERLDRLREITELLRSNETSLESAVQLYEEGMILHGELNEIFEESKQLIAQYNKTNGTITSDGKLIGSLSRNLSDNEK